MGLTDRYITRFINRILGYILLPFARTYSLLSRVIPGLKKLPALKPETLTALLTFVFILTVILFHTFIAIIWTDDSEAGITYWATLPYLIGLLFIIPVVVFLFVKILLAPPTSQFPDIDLAFEAGLTALQKNGISFRETPLYLVLGTPDARKIKQMMAISGRSFDFSHVTADGQALYWYGSAEATYLFLSGVGNICQLTKDLGKYVSQTSSADDYAASGDYKGTIDVKALGSKGRKFDDALAGDDAGPSPDAIKQTIQASDLRRDPEPTQALQRSSEAAPTQKNKTQLSSREKLAEQKRRIAHLCALLQRFRRPVCSLNGIVVALVNRLIEEFPGQLARQAKSDLSTICEKTGVVSTVTVVVTGFENDEGCREFVSRLKEIYGDDFLKRRFGKSYRSWECPTPEHLREIANESIENFDQYVYSIFTQHDALHGRNVQGNRDMVKFVCWIYSRFFSGLETTLMNGFNTDSGNEDFPRFAGCYFMGIGDAPESQFFGDGVFDRIDENQGELEWSSKLLRREENWTLMSQLIFLMGLIAITALGILIFMERQKPNDADSAQRCSDVETILNENRS